MRVRQFHVPSKRDVGEIIGVHAADRGQQAAVSRRVNFADAIVRQAFGIAADPVRIQGLVAVADL